jgi:hypothetical protein
MSHEHDALLGVAEAKLPLRVTGAKRGVGSFLMFDLIEANAHPAPQERWTLWVYLCDWVLLQGGVECLNSDCIDNSIYECWLEKLIGADLLKATATADDESCQFVFANGFELILDDASDRYGDQQDLVKVFKNDSFQFSFKSSIGIDH